MRVLFDQGGTAPAEPKICHIVHKQYKSMIEYKTGDIFAEKAEALVNAVNCVGVMGRGIALQFKRAFPENFKAYAARCRRNAMKPGHVFVFVTGQITNPRYIINFPTKRHWRGKSRMEDIESGLVSLAREIRSRGIRSVAIPALGSGLGGLSWPEVRVRVEGATPWEISWPATRGSPCPCGRSSEGIRGRSGRHLRAGRGDRRTSGPIVRVTFTE